MKLKRYIQFIKESAEETENFYLLDEDEIRSYFVELIDAGYLITVNFGFVKRETVHHYTGPSVEKDFYTEKMVAGEEIRPAYNIVIEKSRAVSKEDVTDSLKFACSIIKGEGDCDIELIAGDGGVLDIDTVLVQGGFFTGVDPEDENSGIELEGLNASLSIFAKQKNTIKITPKDLEDYYSWDVTVKKDGQLWAEIDLDDLADFILYSKTPYKDFLVKGQEHMWEYYNHYDYQPDIRSLLQYSLTKENKKMLVKALIKEMGGLSEMINHIGDECDDEMYEKVKGKSEDEIVDILLGERFYTSLEQLVVDSDVYSSVTEIVADWNVSAHCDDNYKEIVSNFDSLVSDELGQFKKVVKEVEVKHPYYDESGNKKTRTLKEDITYYQFPFSNDWIREVDSEDLYHKSLNVLLRDYIRESNISRNLNPSISDYGNVDEKKMNEDISSLLKKKLS